MPSTFEEIISDLRKRIFKPVYFLAGDEPYYIDLITDFIAEKVLSEEEKAFNQVIIYGEDTSINSIIETSRRFPMMASHQVVIVKEAQALKKIEDLSEGDRLRAVTNQGNRIPPLFHHSIIPESFLIFAVDSS